MADIPDEPSFGWLVFKRAIGDTMDMFEARPRTIFLGFALLAVGPLWSGYSSNWATFMTVDLAQIFKDSIVPVVIVGLILFAWNLWLAPHAVVRDERKVEPTQYDKDEINPEIDFNSFRVRDHLNAFEIGTVLAACNPAKASFENRKEMYKRLAVEGMRLGILATSERREHVTQYSKAATPSVVAWAEKKGLNVDKIK